MLYLLFIPSIDTFLQPPSSVDPMLSPDPDQFHSLIGSAVSTYSQLLLPPLHLSSDQYSYKLHFLLQSAEGTVQWLRCKQYGLCQVFNELEKLKVMFLLFL